MVYPGLRTERSIQIYLPGLLRRLLGNCLPASAARAALPASTAGVYWATSTATSLCSWVTAGVNCWRRLSDIHCGPPLHLALLMTTAGDCATTAQSSARVALPSPLRDALRNPLRDYCPVHCPTFCAIHCETTARIGLPSPLPDRLPRIHCRSTATLCPVHCQTLCRVHCGTTVYLSICLTILSIQLSDQLFGQSYVFLWSAFGQQPGNRTAIHKTSILFV